MTKIVITGHRPGKLGNDYDLVSPLTKKIKDNIIGVLVQYSTGMTYVGDTKTLDGVVGITGMALGIDTLFAIMCVELGIPYVAAIPCHQQHLKWPQTSKQRWLMLTHHELCSKYYVSEKTYTHDCMQKRNEWMVDQLGAKDILLAVWDCSEGGTANCVKYAKKQGKQIIQINPKLL